MIGPNVDKYFTKTAKVVNDNGSKKVTYGVFIRRPTICAVDMAIDFLVDNADVEVVRHYQEGSIVPDSKPLFSYTGDMASLVQLETQMLQRVGFPCVSAYNAYKMTMALPNVPFLDMHARHAPGEDCVLMSAYGASVGSKLAQMQGAKGFIGSSVDSTAAFYGASGGMGTMPHALIGYAGSTLEATKMYVKSFPNEKTVTTLVDYYGKEVTDSCQTALWFSDEEEKNGKRLFVRLDTHGGRFCEGLDYEKSVRIVSSWLHTEGEWSAVETVMGTDFYDNSDDATKDKYRRILFGAGVSAANIIWMRKNLDDQGFNKVGIVVSSGFDLFKCQVMAKVRAPIDMVGTGSFLPKTLSETYATADIYNYDDSFSVKVGREKTFSSL